MSEPTIPSPDPEHFGTRAQPSGSLGGVGHIMDHIDIANYVAWLKSVDVAQLALINSVSSTILAVQSQQTTDSVTLAAVAALSYLHATKFQTEEAWTSWSGPVLYTTGGAVDLGTGATTVAQYRHRGYDVECDFVVTLGTSPFATGSSGLQRINLPVPADAFYATNEGIVGYGHIHDGSGVGPHEVWPIQFHCASGLTASQAGILMTAGNVNDTHYNNVVTGAMPFTPAVGDKYVGKLTYRSASIAS